MTSLSRLTLILTSLFSVSSLAATDTVTSQLGENPTREEVVIVYKSNPDIVLDILTILLRSDNVDPQVSIQSAFEIAPELAEQIAAIAREEGIADELITTAALLSGIDPTQFAQATAAGIASAVPGTPAIAPPTPPAVGANGGGNGVVSPN